MLLNAHSYYSLRYGTLSIEELVKLAKECGYDSLALTDINNSSGALEFVKICHQEGIKPIVGMEFREADEVKYIALARNKTGFMEINELRTHCNLNSEKLPDRPNFAHCYVIFPYENHPHDLKENEYVGIPPRLINKLRMGKTIDQKKYLALRPIVFADAVQFSTHKKLRAVHHNLLLSQVQPAQTASADESIISREAFDQQYAALPHLLENTKRIAEDCHFEFDFLAVKNKKSYTGNSRDDKELLEKLAFDGMKRRYGTKNKEAIYLVKKELEIIGRLGFSAYFLITWDIIRYSKDRGFYHVGRGSGANSVVAYCLGITDVCPIELDLYFERFLNPKRKVPPDFDIDYSWKDRDEVIEYIFKRYGQKHTALLGAMSTFKDRSIIREMGKVHGLPKSDIDRLIKNPASPLNDNELCREVMSIYKSIEDFPNARSIHAGGILISEEPITAYTALDMPPKGFATTQFDMYLAEDINLEKLDILSQRGIGHINECAEIVKRNRGIKIDVSEVDKFKTDKKVRAQLLSSNTIGCFYVESPAMRGLLSKLHCDNYLTLVAASSIIRPGVAKSGMMRAYIERFHHPEKVQYLHPIMEEQLKETFGVMVFQEDVLKVGHHFGGLDLADADVLRRMMSGKSRNKKHLEEIREKYFTHCKSQGYADVVAKEVWRQIESFAGYSFSKAHSASYAVESYQSLYLKTYFPMEFMVAVINNFGGFYNTRVYVNEAMKTGAKIHLPCVNKSTTFTNIYGTDIYLGFVHIKSLEEKVSKQIEAARHHSGEFLNLEDFIRRVPMGMEQLITLIRIDALRFTGKNKRQMLWDAHLQFNEKKYTETVLLFNITGKSYELPALAMNPLEDAYDEIELLEFPVTMSYFDMLKTKQRGDCRAKHLMQHVGKRIRIMGVYVAYKGVTTVRGEYMAFGTFLDEDGDFFDTVNFPPSLSKYPFTGVGVYLILGKVTEEFGFPSLEVDKMARLPIRSDPRI
ncbi:MAG: DNA polymerase III subunit alpha [Bacteroidia bacterium]